MSTKASSIVFRKRGTSLSATPRNLLGDVRELIVQARLGVARAVDSSLVALYWHVGRRLRKDILQEKRAEYGEKILQSLAAKLTAEFGRGYSPRNLANMVRFAEVLLDRNILQSLTANLGWTHFQRIIYLDDPLQRDSYAAIQRV